METNSENKTAETEPKIDKEKSEIPASRTTQVNAFENDLPLPSDMQTNFGPVLRWFFAVFFRHIRFSEDDIATIKKNAENSTVIYILKSRSFISFLFFNYLFLKFDLPLARFVNAIQTKFYMSLRKLREYNTRRVPGFTGSTFEEETRLSYLTRLGESSMIFLEKPNNFYIIKKKKREPNYLQVLVEQQRKLERSITLIPIMLLYDKRPPKDPPSFFDILFNIHDNLTWFHDFLIFLWRHRSARVRISEPVNLKDYMKEHNESDEVIARQIKGMLVFQIKREQEVVTGPTRQSISYIKRLVLYDQKLQETIKRLADGDAKKEAELNSRAETYLDKLAADMDLYHLGIFNWALMKFWNIMRLVVRFKRQQVNTLRSYARKAPLVFCPAHRSHLDYLLVSQILFYCDLVPPHIAAGENLSFWPMGYIFRKSGAFFIRRTFKGDELYIALFKAYLRRLLRGYHSIEFFLEGTRSRTGKMLTPKTGLLGMIYEAYLEGMTEDIYFVPVYPSYEKLPDIGSYTKELIGTEKRKESFGALVKSSRFLVKRFGNVDVRFGTPISLREFLTNSGVDVAQQSKEEQKTTIKSLAYAISYEATEQATVNASQLVASALLEETGAMLSFEEIMEKANFMIRVLPQAEKRLASGLTNDLEKQLKDVINLQIADHNIKIVDGEYTATSKGRFALDYYKNIGLHYYVTRAIGASSLLACANSAPTVQDLTVKAKELKNFLKYEFIFRFGTNFEAEFAEVLDWAQANQYLKHENGIVRLGSATVSDLHFLRSLISPFLYAYILATRAIVDIEFKALYRTDFIKQAIQRGNEIINATGELPPEACNRTTLDNAISMLIDQGFIEEVFEEGLEGAPKGGILVPKEKGKRVEERQVLASAMKQFTGKSNAAFADMNAPIMPKVAPKSARSKKR